eukprot:jgi/Botrbrau1/17590/Bobra.0166s0032.1
MKWNGLSQVVLLDNNKGSPYDGLWAAVAAGGGVGGFLNPWTSRSARSYTLARQAKQVQVTTLFRKAAFVPSVLQDFQNFLLRPLGLWPRPIAKPLSNLQVLFLGNQWMDTELQAPLAVANPGEVVEMLRTLPDITITPATDFASMPLEAQIRLAANTDVLIGVHGSNLAFSLFMPAHGALLEVLPASTNVSKSYQHVSAWMGLLYRRWEAPVTTNKFLEGFDLLSLDVVGFRSVVLPLIQEVLARRHTQGSQKFDGDPHEVL